MERKVIGLLMILQETKLLNGKTLKLVMLKVERLGTQLYQ